MDTLSKTIKLFYSYSHDDTEYKKKLEKHLTILKRQGLLESWDDTQILPGDVWDMGINENLLKADIILLLISSSFMDSDYINDVELKIALERHQKNEARVIPIILRNCFWKIAPFAKLQALPAMAKPVENWKSPDDAFTDIAKGIYNVIVANR